MDIQELMRFHADARVWRSEDRVEARQKYQKEVNVNGEVLHQTVENDDERDKR